MLVCGKARQSEQAQMQMKTPKPKPGGDIANFAAATELVMPLPDIIMTLWEIRAQKFTAHI